VIDSLGPDYIILHVGIDQQHRGVELIKVEWEPLPHVLDAEQALLQGAPQLHDDKPGNVSVRIFVNEGEPIRSLLTDYRIEIAKKTKMGDPTSLRLLTYIDKLLSAFPGFAPEKIIREATLKCIELAINRIQQNMRNSHL
jgi:hypothetical protein